MQNFIRIALALALLPLMASPSRASANILKHPLISEIQTGTALSASQEFVELYNPSDSDIPLSGWTIEYKAATSTNTETSWSKKAALSGSIAAQGFYLVAQKTYIAAADAEWSPTLASSAGHIRLKDADGIVIDLLGYGETSNGARGAPAASPATGASIERLPGRLEPQSGNGVDSDNNAADFIVRTVPEPQATTSAIEVPGEVPAAPEADEIAEEAAAPTTYAPISISEALVDPQTPLTDAEDEFIELYNPTSESVDLQDYTLRSGSNFRDYYKIPGLVIPAQGYTVLYARETKLGLTNGGGAVQLVDPSGEVIDQTPDYPAALAGQSWAAFPEGWQWTLQLTPGQANVLAALPVSVATTAKPKATIKKAAAKAAPKAKKAAAPKVAKPKKPRKAKIVPTSLAALPMAASRNLQPSTWLIITLAILTIGYALYEFRYDIYYLYRKLRGDSPARANGRLGSEGRRRD